MASLPTGREIDAAVVKYMQKCSPENLANCDDPERLYIANFAYIVIRQ